MLQPANWCSTNIKKRLRLLIKNLIKQLRAHIQEDSGTMD